MDDTIQSILGADEDEEGTGVPELAAGAGAIQPGATTPASPVDSETDELGHLWISGNKGEVIQRYMEMTNEKSVRLVFTIGLEGSLELARIVDGMLEQEKS